MVIFSIIKICAFIKKKDDTGQEGGITKGHQENFGGERYVH